MRTVRTLRSLLGICALTLGLTVAMAAAPTKAHAQVPVLCSETSLVNAINSANAADGETLALFPFCTYQLTSAHGTSPHGAVGLPPITTPITLLGMGVTITRAPGAPAFRILQVEGAANVPGTKGQLSAVGLTPSAGGSAVSPYPGGGLSNLGGTVSMLSSAVTGNSAIAGGGIYNDNGSITLTTSSVTGNEATSSGGGIYVNSGGVTLLGTSVRDNTPDNCAPSGSVMGCT
ncbi:hypothetical protein ACFWJW_04910 [Streptomyces sp. NPDC127097]|uniref:hypothetical protein n=1 Tax=Streptomyces sp. NPDC127097 TaxID=3347136 RepID=UPI003660E6BF